MAGGGVEGSVSVRPVARGEEEDRSSIIPQQTPQLPALPCHLLALLQLLLQIADVWGKTGAT